MAAKISYSRLKSTAAMIVIPITSMIKPHTKYFFGITNRLFQLAVMPPSAFFSEAIIRNVTPKTKQIKNPNTNTTRILETNSKALTQITYTINHKRLNSIEKRQLMSALKMLICTSLLNPFFFSIAISSWNTRREA